MLNATNSHTTGKANLLEMRSAFISLATHEFKTPISAISSSIELLETKMQRDELMLPFYERNLSRIKEEIDILKNMVDDILTTGSMVAGNPVTQPEVTDILPFARMIREQYFSQRADRRRLHITVSGRRRNISIDNTHLASIFTNLISNAFKYSSGPGPLLCLHYRKDQLCIKVKDNGIGIPEKDIRFLFTPFFRAGNAIHKEGTGLGLAIVKSFVKANGGQITVSSNEAGSVFTVTFPY
ncbi:sensor histidine kinase [Chitinophaga arvensicola]|uniref:histidine kinase n=1 Tax=Chitinophaga arvensicola TaxID=29529 RepID=A0A1I0SDT8_9BACT|nr:HAMP domain-containing sensor histidine kinase [Chitinophaga arvensicola]SEW54203.1 His Kinase A (phospho-acceptor) domain-containing protein [Chitinophaga arvensicola]